MYFPRVLKYNERAGGPAISRILTFNLLTGKFYSWGRGRGALHGYSFELYVVVGFSFSPRDREVVGSNPARTLK